MRKFEEMKNVRFSADCVETLTNKASEWGIPLAEILEAMSYGLLAQAAVFPGKVIGARWSALRVVHGPEGKFALEAITASSVQQLGERLGVFGCDCHSHPKAA